MSGTYQIDGELFPKNPLTKHWSPPQRIAGSGVGEPIFQPFRTFEMTFGILNLATEVPFFEGKLVAGGLHSVVLPHPETGNLTGFTGTSVEEFDYTFSDIDRDSFTEDGPRLVLGHINLSATGTV